jgi:hypothetical protein
LKRASVAKTHEGNVKWLLSEFVCSLPDRSIQMMEALQMQMEMQKRLHEQLEVSHR